jgi:hypothetical protein
VHASIFVWSFVNLLQKPLKSFVRLLESILYASVEWHLRFKAGRVSFELHTRLCSTLRSYMHEFI